VPTISVAEQKAPVGSKNQRGRRPSFLRIRKPA
jgi:hypothetical protein